MKPFGVTIETDCNMKPIETFLGEKKHYSLIALLCIIYGGFSLLLFTGQLYTAFWRTDLVGLTQLDRPFGAVPDLNRLDTNHADLNGLRSEILNRINREPLAIIASPTSLFYLFGGIISILAGVSLWRLLHEKEIKKIKEQAASNLLLPEEKKVIDALRAANFESTQSVLTRDTGLNKVQIHRTIGRLEAKGLVEKHPFGMTNKIILKKDVTE